MESNHMTGIQKTIDNLPPAEAVKEIAEALKKLLPLIGDEARIEFVENIIGNADGDGMSLVHY